MVIKQCNLCGLREDTGDLVPQNKTWCLVYGKEVDNKHQNCVYWQPDSPSIMQQKVQIANQIGREIRAQELRKTVMAAKRKAAKGELMNKKSVSGKGIWNDIERDYGMSKKALGKKINFVTDKFKRKVIFRDIEQAYTLSNYGFSKPAAILAGGVIEELLRLYLNKQKIKPSSYTFDSYIRACEDKKLLKSGIRKLTDAFRYFRNTVHLSIEKAPKNTISKATAKSAVASIFTLANDFE